MKHVTIQPTQTDKTWLALGKHLRFFRLLLVAALAFLGMRVAGGGWTQFNGQPGRQQTLQTLQIQASLIAAVDSTDVSQEIKGSRFNLVGESGNISQRPAGGADRARASITISAPQGVRQQAAEAPASRVLAITATDGTNRLDTVPKTATFPLSPQDVIRTSGNRLGKWIVDWQRRSDESWRTSTRMTGASLGNSIRLLAQRRRRQAAAPVTEALSKAVPQSPPKAKIVSIDVLPAKIPQGVTLVNPTQTRGTVHFLLNGQISSLTPGQSRKFEDGDAWAIEFHRGGEFGDAVFTLSQGVYSFKVTRNGWDLSPADDRAEQP